MNMQHGRVLKLKSKVECHIEVKIAKFFLHKNINSKYLGLVFK